jgi:UDP-N-acetylglucosamine 1-carboxyvinyltransferase
VASVHTGAVADDAFLVRESPPLEGVVWAGGAKNSALKLMAACLLAPGRHVLEGVPAIGDVATMSELLERFGARVRREPSAAGSPGDLVVEVPETLVPEAPYELVERIRASIVVLGPLLARAGEAHVSLPGGDDFGSRPVDLHLGGLEALGARFELEGGYIHGVVAERVADRPRLVGSRVVLGYPSHTATDNLLMAAALAKGTTVIENAAREPEVVDLATMLTKMGAVVRGAGTSRIEVEGADALVPVRHRVVPDRVVAATFLAAAGITGGKVVVADGRAEHMEMLVAKLGEMGVRVRPSPDGLVAEGPKRPRSVDVATLPYPGVATDYEPFLVALLSVADGVAIVTENLFFGRLRYVDELRRMGADVRTEGHHVVVRGVERLTGAPVKAPDIRGGAALVLAGLAARGETLVAGAAHVDRGYEDFAGRLRSLGADVTRIQAATQQ